MDPTHRRRSTPMDVPSQCCRALVRTKKHLILHRLLVFHSGYHATVFPVPNGTRSRFNTVQPCNCSKGTFIREPAEQKENLVQIVQVRSILQSCGRGGAATGGLWSASTSGCGCVYGPYSFAPRPSLMQWAVKLFRKTPSSAYTVISRGTDARGFQVGMQALVRHTWTPNWCTCTPPVLRL